MNQYSTSAEALCLINSPIRLHGLSYHRKGIAKALTFIGMVVGKVAPFLPTFV
jgi:hypothetical protein